MQDLVVIGGGEHARVVIEAARTCPDLWNIRGFVDVQTDQETERRLSVPRLGGDVEGRNLAAGGRVRFVMGLAGLGSLETRLTIVKAYDEVRAHWATIVHANAWVSPTAHLSHGVFVSAGAVVNTGARIERHAVINTSAVIEHDAIIEAFAHVAPRAVIGGGARIGAGTYVGLGACVRDHVAIGEGSTIGMGSVVVGPVAPNLVVIGNPAKKQGSLKQ